MRATVLSPKRPVSSLLSSYEPGSRQHYLRRPWETTIKTNIGCQTVSECWGHGGKRGEGGWTDGRYHHQEVIPSQPRPEAAPQNPQTNHDQGEESDDTVSDELAEHIAQDWAMYPWMGRWHPSCRVARDFEIEASLSVATMLCTQLPAVPVISSTGVGGLSMKVAPKY